MSVLLNPVALAQAMKYVFDDCDNAPNADGAPADFIFIHGSPTNNDQLDDMVLAVATGLFSRGQAKAVVINGLEVSGEARLAYPGANVWEPKLHDLGVKTVGKIPPSMHTAAEVEAVIKLASEMGSRRILVASQRHHMPRVMCQWDYCLRQSKSDLKVKARSFHAKDCDWKMKVKKVVLNGGVEEGTLLDLFAGEIIRIGMYADPNCFDPQTGKKKYTPNSTPEELIAYYKGRDLK